VQSLASQTFPLPNVSYERAARYPDEGFGKKSQILDWF
jgi:hypothetical protein